MKYLNRYDDAIIDPERPWEDDIFRLKGDGERLARLIESINQTYVIALRGEWGTGKSVFIRRLSAHLENIGIATVVVDAWRTDYEGDPLRAFSAELQRRIEKFQRDTPDASKKSRLKEVSKTLSDSRESLLKLLGQIAAPIADAHAPGSGAAVAVGSRWFGRKIAKKPEDAIEGFGNALRQARDVLTVRDAMRPISKHIVFFVDELDRCRPEYAVKTLERIKHFFSVRGVIFVIATDGDVLPNAISHIYGAKEEQADKYLRKFIDFEYMLPMPSPHTFTKVLSIEFGMNDLIGDLDIAEHRRLFEDAYARQEEYLDMYAANRRGVDALEAIDFFPEVAQRWGLPLREQSQAFNMITAVLRTMAPNEVCFPSVLVYLCCLRFAAPGVYTEFRRDKSIFATTLHGNIGIQRVTPDGQGGADLSVFADAQARPVPRMDFIRGRVQDRTLAGRLPHAWWRLYTRVHAREDDVFDFPHRALGLATAFDPDAE